MANRYGNCLRMNALSLGALVWLLSDASRFVTGSMICVDGGFSIFGGV